MLRDLRFACRLAWRERWFSAAVVLVLALGIGVNAIGFSIINAAFLRDLPFEDPQQLHVLSWRLPSGGESDVSYPEYQEWRERSRTLALGAFRGAAFTIADDRRAPRAVRGARVTANVFSLLREPPLLGRDFAEDEDRTGAKPVAIISASLWRSHFGADGGVIGRTLRVNGQPSTIVGVMREGMQFPGNADLWVPLIPSALEEQRDERVLTVLGRVRDDRRAAQAELDALAATQARAFRDASPGIADARLQLQTLTEAFVGGPAARMLIAVMVAACLVLLIACANVAHLLLSRVRARTREMALRMSIGATRWRIVRQLLIECGALAFAGGGLGLLIAAAGIRVFEAAMADSGKPYWIVFTVDYAVFVYVAVACVLTALGAGLVPALLVSNRPASSMRENHSGSRRVRRLSGGLIVAELALSCVLLAGGGLVGRSFMKLYAMDPGFSVNQLTVASVRLREDAYRSADVRRTFVDRFSSRLAGTAGVDAVAVTTGVPPDDGGERLVEIDAAAGSTAAPRFVSTVTISPSFFETLGLTMIAGRGFTGIDGATGSETVVVNQRFAARFFANENPIGRRLRFVPRRPVPGTPPDVWRTIVGVSADIRQGSRDDGYLNAVAYIPYRQDAPPDFSLIIRSTLDANAVTTVAAREAQALDRDQPVLRVQTMDQVLADNRRFHRIFGGVFAFLAGVALVLSTLGLYAVMAYSVTQRTREIGVRVAVGAQPHHVSWLILKLGFERLAIGLAIGMAGAMVLSRAVQVLLVDMTPTDPLTLTAIAVLLSGAGVTACLHPMRRALRVDPVVALRAE